MTSTPKPPHCKAARPRWFSTSHDRARRDIASRPALARQSSLVVPVRLLARASSLLPTSELSRSTPVLALDPAQFPIAPASPTRPADPPPTASVGRKRL